MDFNIIDSGFDVSQSDKRSLLVVVHQMQKQTSTLVENQEVWTGIAEPLLLMQQESSLF